MSADEVQPGQGSFGDLVTTVRQDRISNGRNVFSAGFQALAVHRFGGWQEGLPAPVRPLTRALFGMLNGFVRNFYGIELPLTVKVGRHVTFGHQHGVVIHPFAEIGDGCVLRHGVSLAAATGQTNYDRWVTEAPRLGKRVKVGVGAVLIGRITVGDDTRIGPNVVLTRSVPAGSTVVVDAPRVLAVPVPDRPARPTVESDPSAGGPSPLLDLRPDHGTDAAAPAGNDPTAPVLGG